MSDTADAQGDFTIERIVDADENPERGELYAARRADKRDPGREAVNAAASPQKAAPLAREEGLPDRVRRKYYVVAKGPTNGGAGLEARVYADERGEYLAFKVVENRLTTRLPSAQVIHDMVAVAEHRNWQIIRLRGSVEFRREAWLEASARGIEAKGYEPTDIDRQALAHRRASREGANRRPPETWGRSNANRSKRGDRLDMRQADQALDNVTVIDAAAGKARADRRQVSQDRWRARAERLRAANRKAPARDPDLIAEQSQLAIIEKALERAFPRDPQARERILEAAKERIAQHLELGRFFPRAMVKERVPEYDRPQNERSEARRTLEEVREKTHRRER